jgi:hypothetical protein
MNKFIIALILGISLYVLFRTFIHFANEGAKDIKKKKLSSIERLKLEAAQ